MDRPVIENRDQRPGAFGDAVGGAKLVEQIDKVGEALVGAGVHQKAPTHRVEDGPNSGHSAATKSRLRAPTVPKAKRL